MKKWKNNFLHMARDSSPHKYNYLGGIQKQIALRCEALIKEVNDRNPGVTGWLLGGIDVERMERVKKEIEEEIK